MNTERERKRPVLVAFGGNQGSPKDTFEAALVLLADHLGPPTNVSSLYETEPLTLHGEQQPTYLNCVARFESSLAPHAILTLLLNVEERMGRRRFEENERWMPRVIDLDLLFVADMSLQSEGLTLPHPELHKRDFVLVPLVEIAPEYTHPLLKVTALDLEKTLCARGFERFVLRRVGPISYQRSTAEQRV